VELLPLTLARLLVERAIYKISSFQNIRSARLILALQRRKDAKSEKEFFLRTFASLRPFDRAQGMLCERYSENYSRLCRAGIFGVNRYFATFAFLAVKFK
jgi:hypothetical protein